MSIDRVHLGRGAGRLEAVSIWVVVLLAGCASSGGEQLPAPFAAELSPPAGASDPSPVSADGPAWELEPLSPPALSDLPYRLILDPERPVPGSLSVGTASTGSLVGSQALPLDGETLYVLSTHHARRANFATDELASILERVGERLLARYPGTRVPLGDASGQDGGDIPHHASHNGGRDLDIPFFVVSPSGRPLTTTGFARFDASLRRGRLVFDVERNWTFLRYFLEEAEGSVQWAFVANWLKRALLDYAIAQGEPKDIIAMAADVMWQPGDSSPHDDHFHLRLYCSREDRLEGCINWGPEWSWSERFDDAHETRVGELARALSDEDVEVRVAAVAFLAQIDGRQLGPRLAAALPSQPPDVQLAILAALSQFRTGGVGQAVTGLYRSSDDDRVRAAALDVAVAYPMPEAAAALVAIAGEGCDEALVSGVPACRTAVRALLEVQDPTLVQALIPLLDNSDGEARALAARVLQRTTGRTDDVDWRWAGAPTRAAAIAEWWAWYEANETAERLEWLRQSFGAQGYALPESLSTRAALEVLIEAMHDSEPIGYIANGLLREVTGESGPPARWRHSRQREYWQVIALRFE